jgi:SAM-dependent methyltransferase
MVSVIAARVRHEHDKEAVTNAGVAYSGVENLEVMDEAVNYNRFLRGLVTARAHPSNEILDFGAGTGALARPLARAGYNVTCIEPDPSLRAHLSAEGLRASSSLDGILPESLDLIYTVNVLEHIEDDLATVAALGSRLKVGGSLVVYVPAFPLLYSSMDRKVGHLRRYRRAGLEALLRSAGLTIERTKYQDCLGFAATLLFRLIGNDAGTINRRALIAYDRCLFPLSRALDPVTGAWIGKNLLAVAHRNA